MHVSPIKIACICAAIGSSPWWASPRQRGMEPRAPDDMIDLAGAGTPSFAADVTARSDGAFVAYGSRSSVWIAEVDGARGAPKELKLSEDGSVFQVREGAPPFPLLHPSCLTSTPRCDPASAYTYMWACLHVGLVRQVRWLSLGGSERLVAAAERSVQVWNADGSLLALCWALPKPPAGFEDKPFYACSMAAVGPTESMYIGASSGDVYVFATAGVCRVCSVYGARWLA